MDGTNKDFAPVAIIGYGTAGVNAIIALRNAGYEGEIRVFSDIDTLPYSPILTSYYAGGEKTREECFPWSAEELADLKAEILNGHAVTQLDPEAHVIRCGQEEFSYSKCLIATGASPTLVGWPQVEGYEPLVLRSMDDAEKLRVALEDAGCERVLVSGASMIALKTLEACLNHGKRVTLVGMNPHVLDFNALPEAAKRFEKGLAGYGVELRLGQTIASVRRVARDAVGGADANAETATGASAGTRDWQLEVTFSNGEAECFDEVSVSHGVKSNLDFVTPGSLQMDRGLIVDEFMRTSNPDVYAAGDVAQALELVSGQKRIVGIWKNAAIQGACAGAAIAAELASEAPSKAHAFKGAMSMNTIAVKDTLFISSGTMELTPERSVEIREEDDMTVVYIFEDCEDGKHRLAGFNLVCDHDEEGSVAYDTAAMLTLRIEAAYRR